MDIEGIIAILSRLVAFDTTSRNSNLPLMDWIEDFLRPLGFTLERLPDPTGRKANLLATVGPAGRAGYVLSGHTDVVAVDAQAWTSDPFTLRREGERLYGRGACDMKGFLAVCLAAARRIAEARLEKPIHLAFSYDEEVGCVGVRSLVERLAVAEVKPEACFVGEPTGMGVVIRCQKTVSWAFTIGRSGLAPFPLTRNRLYSVVCRNSIRRTGSTSPKIALVLGRGFFLAVKLRLVGLPFRSGLLFAINLNTLRAKVLSLFRRWPGWLRSVLEVSAGPFDGVRHGLSRAGQDGSRSWFVTLGVLGHTG